MKYKIDDWNAVADYVLSRLVYILVFGNYIMGAFVEEREEGEVFWAYFFLVCGIAASIYVYRELTKGALVKGP